MTDADPYNQFDPDQATPAAPAVAKEADPYDQFGAPVTGWTKPPDSAAGSFARGAERSIVPAVGGLAGAGAGAEAGAAIGGGLGVLAGGVGAFPAAAVGGFVGGLAGFFGGSWGAGAVQDYALKAAPDSWKEAIGQDDRQQKLDQEEHPYASFLGGLAPYALTMNPVGAAAKLPATATALDRVLANPVTARVFSGAAMGGMELGQEKVEGEPTDWGKVFISTGFGVVSNRPNRIGETIMGAGARIAMPAAAFARNTAGALAISRALETTEPTIAQAHDLKVMGPGVTESVFQGTQEMDPAAQRVAEANAANEQETIGPFPSSPWSVQDLARRLEPELFDRRDALRQQVQTFRDWISDFNNPGDEEFGALDQQEADLQKQMAAVPYGRGGESPEVGRLRAMINDVRQQRIQLQARREGSREETPELATARQHLMATDFQLRDVERETAAAYRRAAERTGAEIVEPEAVSPETEAAAPEETAAESASIGQKPAETTPAEVPPQQSTPRSIADQRAFITSDMRRKLIAAGRPEDEAQAAAELVSARYETRAAHLQGLAGTAEDLYRAQYPDIRGVDTLPRGAFGRLRTAEGLRPVLDLAAKADASTWVHESGHQWLNEIMEDAQHPAAPDSLKADAATVRRYLGASDSLGRVTGYQTAMGSEYTIHDDGTTTRNKSDHSAVGHESGDTGLKPRSTKTIYVDAKLASALSAAGLTSNEGTSWRVALRDGKANLISREGTGRWGVSSESKDISFATEPAIGLAPLELWRLRDDVPGHEAYSGMHAGNAITRIDKANASYTLTGAQHERFAKSFEQYMREGTAPSAQLAGVFAKFKNWLTSVYQTAKRLGRPISDDIRGVFDRMLAEEPQRTVVMPEQAGGPTLAGIHGVDAAETEPSQAAIIATRVREERTRAAAEASREIADEVAPAVAEAEQATRPAGEPGPGNTGRPEVAAGGGEAGNESGRSGVGKAADEVGAGGSAPVAEGAGVPGTAGRRPAAGPERKPLAPAALAEFPSRESPIVDKAGNLRLDNIPVEDMETLEGIKRIAREAAAANNDYTIERRSVITDGMLLDYAVNTGNEHILPLIKRNIGSAFSAEELKFLEKMWAQSTDAAREAALRLADSGSDEDALAYAQARATQQTIQGTYSRGAAEAGRATRALRKTRQFWSADTESVAQALAKSSGTDLYQLKQEAKFIKSLNTSAKVSRFLDSAKERSFGRAILEYWINGLISGPITHATYVIGNEVLRFQNFGLERLVAAGIGEVQERLGRTGERFYAGEVRAAAEEYLRAQPKAQQAAVEALRSGLTTGLPGETTRPLAPFEGDVSRMLRSALSVTNNDVTWQEAGNDWMGLVRGMRDGIVANAALLGTEKGISLQRDPLGQIADVKVAGAVFPTGQLARLPSRGVAAIHSFHRTVNYSVSIGTQAFRAATQEMRAGTLAQDKFAERVAYLRQNPSEAMMERARTESNDLTLTGAGGQFVQKLSAWTNVRLKLPLLGETPVLKFIDPFVHIAASIIDQSIVQRTPVGLLSSELRADLVGKNGNLAQDTATARMLVGTGLALTFGALAAEGYVSGSGPSDPHLAAVWRLAGNQANSVRIGDGWFDVHRLGAMGMLLGVAADMYDVAHAATSEGLLSAGSALMHALTQNVLDESFMKGPADLIQAVEDHDRYGERYIQNFMSSFVPYSVGLAQMARASDPYSREARTVMDSIRQKVPGVSESLFPRRDIWGEEMPNREALGRVTAIYESHISRDPVNQALLALNYGPAPVERRILNVPLTDGQYDDYARIAGRLAKMRLDVYVRSPEWQRMPPNARRDLVRTTINMARESARGMMKMKYPTIPAAATQAKKDKFQ